MAAGRAAAVGRELTEGTFLSEDTVLRAMDQMQRLGLDRIEVVSPDGEPLGALGESEIYRAWSLDPLARLSDLVEPRLVEVRQCDRERGMVTAIGLLGRSARR